MDVQWVLPHVLIAVTYQIRESLRGCVCNEAVLASFYCPRLLLGGNLTWTRSGETIMKAGYSVSRVYPFPYFSLLVMLFINHLFIELFV